MSSENPIEREFLDQYMEGHPYTRELFRYYYNDQIRQHLGEFFTK